MIRRRWLAAPAALLAWFGTAHAAPVPILRAPVRLLLQAEPGELVLQVAKRDLNLYAGADELHVELFDPQRRRVAVLDLPDDGKPGKGEGAQTESQTGELRATVELAGVYRALFRGSSDMIYGFESNCPRWVADGPMTFNNGQAAGRIWFAPPAGPVKLVAAAIHNPGKQSIPLYDAAGEVVHSFDLTGDQRPEDLFGAGSSGGYVTGERYEVPADAGDRSGLWSFDVARLDVRLQVDGVTAWSLDRGAWFPAAWTRWMLLPYSQTRYLAPGESARLSFELRNSTPDPGRFQVEVHLPEGVIGRVLAPELPVAVEAGEVVPVEVELSVPGSAALGRRFEGGLTASLVGPTPLAASAGLVVDTGDSPVGRPLDLPIVLAPYRHENAQFGYAPDYVANEVYFDRDDRPWIRHRTDQRYPSEGITLLADGQWVLRSFMPAIREAYPALRGFYFGAGFLGAKIAFDGEGGAYTPLRLILDGNDRQDIVVYTPDAGRSHTVHPILGEAFDLEQFTGHNALDLPPPVVATHQTADHPSHWATINDLVVYLPRQVDGGLELGEPILVSDRCIGLCQHSGGPATTATRDGKTHVVWGEATDEDLPGVPTYIATIDHATRTVSPKVLLAYAPPLNDVHNAPGICLDSDGYLHVVTGAHGQPFRYTRSLKPSDTQSGWTEPVDVLDAGDVEDTTDADGAGRQTYLSLVCGPDDTLHIAYRQWRRNADEHFPNQIYAALSYQSKPKNGPWSPARPIVIPACPGYSIYYHKLTIDRHGRLYLSHSYWTQDATYQDDFPYRYHHRAVVTSSDGGKSWKLLETSDFAR